jgi:asparagine synthase (glutamine-hydrolysing)
MLQVMMHEPFYVAETYENERMGFYLGGVNPRGAFADCLPIWNEHKDVGLIFSGEEFSDPDEVRRLRESGHGFDQGDASYLVHLYEERGTIPFLSALNGRFSGALVDLREPHAVVFNDRYGLNRICFLETTEGFYFSSEAKSLLVVFPELRRLDFRSLGEVFSCGAVLQNRTLFSGLNLMPGASAWSFSPGRGVKKDVYFRPETWENSDALNGPEYYRTLKETWAHILPRYLRAREPVAVSLTGGKDSRMIMAWAAAAPGTLPCYTFNGPYRECHDVKLARAVAKLCGQPHHVISVDSGFWAEFPTLAERTVYISDGTMDVSGSVELYVNRGARQIAPVRLTGNYGQEILRSAIAFKPFPGPLAVLQPEFAAMVGETAATYSGELGGNRLSFVAFKQVPWHHYSRLAIELSQLTLRSPFLDNDLVALAYRVPPELAEDIGIQLKLIAEGNPALARVETDRGFSSETGPLGARAKQLFQEFTFKAEYAYDYGMPQWLAVLDHAFQVFHLERLFLGRHKFYHFRIWYRRELADYVREVLLDPRALRRPYVDGRKVREIVHAHIRGTRNYASEIHTLLTAELIQRQLTD